MQERKKEMCNSTRIFGADKLSSKHIEEISLP
jgi:hypothetical protein